jgi:sugar/nucleoside kinase (ribokinase family)
LAAALNRGANEQEALHFAVAAASLSTTRRGALASLPDRDEVDRLLARE